MRPQNQRGFTLVELLVVIAIIAILVGLTMPAVNAAREAMRRSTCRNNLYQMSRAILAYEAKNQSLPGGGWGSLWAGDPKRGVGAKQPGGWHYSILPYMDGQSLYDAPAAQAVDMPVDTFVCPTRRRAEHVPYSSSSGAANNFANAGAPTTTAHSDYAGNAGDLAPTDFSYRGPASLGDGDKMTSAAWAAKPGGSDTGVIFRHSECKMGSLLKGYQFVYLIGERYMNSDFYRTGTSPDDDQGWNIGYDCEVNRWGAMPPRRDDRTLPSGVSAVQSYTWFGSAHAAGFNMAFCDGSVQQLSYAIDPTTHRRLSNRLDRTPIDSSQIK